MTLRRGLCRYAIPEKKDSGAAKVIQDYQKWSRVNQWARQCVSCHSIALLALCKNLSSARSTEKLFQVHQCTACLQVRISKSAHTPHQAKRADTIPLKFSLVVSVMPVNSAGVKSLMARVLAL